MTNQIQYNVDKVDTTSLRSSNRSPVSVNETFWVPATSQRHQSETNAGSLTGINLSFFCRSLK